ncbi:MAG TPA: DUF998 domain-containing protein [Longimicrobiales bacterium]|nr:DUF998 domain-containing protein [Longimicrobiales bacterium]
MTSPPAGSVPAVARRLLTAGMIAGPLYLLVGYAQALTRDGFDMSRHALSLLSNGDYGWIQTGNFLVTGALVLAGALGLRFALAGSRAGTWGPILMALYGVGLLGAGVFPADPGADFPPGTPAPTAMTRGGLLHFVFGGLGFYALIAACFVFARRHAARGERGWMAYSVVTGILFALSFGAIASGSTSPTTIIAFYAAVTWIWLWHAAVHYKVLTGTAAFREIVHHQEARS